MGCGFYTMYRESIVLRHHSGTVPSWMSEEAHEGKKKNLESTMTAIGYEDMLGFKFLLLHRFAIQWAGVRTDISSGNDPIGMKIAQFLGIFFAILATLQASAAALAGYDRMLEK
ncbi:unnamed protein product, partial [Nesidiocoris tenuis]